MSKKILSAVLIIFMTGCSGDIKENNTAQLSLNSPITRGQAVKMLALSRYSMNEIDSMQREIDFSDCNESDWCDKYINASVKAGLISGTQENTFLPDDMLSLEQAGFIIKNAAGDKNLVLQFDQTDRKKPIASEIWYQAFDSIKNNVEEKEIVIFADKNICPSLKDGYVLSSEGLLNCEGVEIKSEIFNRGVKAYVKDNCILALKDLSEKNPVIKNVVIEEQTPDGIRIGINGIHVTFKCSENVSAGQNADVKIHGNEIIEIKT